MLGHSKSQSRSSGCFVRTLSGATSAASVTAHGDGLLVSLDILEESDGTLELPAVDGLGGLAGVLERNPEVGTAGAGRLGGLDLGGGVTDLYREKQNPVSHSFMKP